MVSSIHPTQLTGSAIAGVCKGVVHNLFSLMQQRAAEAGPIRVGVIGAGKFASMFLTQAVNSEGIHVVGVADMDVPKAKGALPRAGWPEERYAAESLDEAVLTAAPPCSTLEHPHRPSARRVILEVTGDPIVGTYHPSRRSTRKARRHGQRRGRLHGRTERPPTRARRPASSTRWPTGQPALISELVDSCRTVGFDVVAAARAPVPSRVRLLDPRHGVELFRLHARVAPPTTTTRRCSTRSSTAPSGRSGWRPWPTEPPHPAGRGADLPAGESRTTCRSLPRGPVRRRQPLPPRNGRVASSLIRNGSELSATCAGAST